MTRSSAYEGRDLGRARTIVVQDGRILGTLDEHGDLIRLDEPPADDPSTWPSSWWTRVFETGPGRRVPRWRRP